MKLLLPHPNLAATSSPSSIGIINSIFQFMMLLDGIGGSYLLQCVKDDGDQSGGNPINGCLKFSCYNILSPRNRFELVPGEDTSCFHVRCCSNDKYLVRNSQDDYFIVASSPDPNEDKSDWQCTLFKRSPLGFTNRLLHVQLDHQLSIGDHSILVADENSHNDFVLIDMESLVFLPKKVLFKGYNKKYLVANGTTLTFAGDDKADEKAHYEIQLATNGAFGVKSTYTQKYWCHQDGEDDIYLGDKRSDDRYPFMLAKVDSNVIAVRLCYSDRFGARDKNNNFSLSFAGISKESWLTVEEPIVFREIRNVNYHLSEARMYNSRNVTLHTQEVSNLTDEETTLTMTFTQKSTKTVRWDASGAIKGGLSVTITAGVPLVVEGTLEVSVEASYEHDWGASESYTEEKEVYHVVTVPKLSKRMVSMVAAVVSYDIPFSYDQIDRNVYGKLDRGTFEDGMYIGSNNFDFQFEDHEIISL